MTPRERRERLFKRSRPYIRPFEPKDMGWLWTAYKSGSFKFRDAMSQEEFAEHMMIALGHQKSYLVEDHNSKFQSGIGPVALIGVMTDGFKIEPAFAVFKWASPRNVLRVFVAFFQWVKSSREIGVCEIRAPSKESRILKKMVDYGVLFPKATEIIFSVMGKKRKER